MSETAVTPDKEADTRRAEYYQAYEEHAKTLRAWFIALGVGGPGFLLAQTEISKGLNEDGTFVAVVLLFLIGIFVQALVVFLNKTVMWVIYYTHEPDKKGTPPTFVTKVADYLSEQFWIDIVADLLTAGLFSFAVILILCSRI